MRIIAGRIGGRMFKSPSGHTTHPMSDKMRGALFNSLGDISGLTVLDAFAGSGALGFEAVSRGAATALLLEKDRLARRAITENIAELGIGQQAKLVSASAGSWLKTSDQTFDIVLLDPPYNKIQIPLLVALVTRVNSGGTVVVSWPGKVDPLTFEGLELVRHKQYGDGTLCFYDSISR